MLLTALKLKVAALVAVAGIETGDLVKPSSEITKIMENLQKAQEAVQKNPQDATAAAEGTSAFNTAVKEAQALADKGDPNACYALAHWGILAGSKDVNINTIVALYRKAGDLPAAQVELAQVLLQGFRQDADKAAEAIDLIIKAEAAGNKLARRTKAQLHLSGQAAPKIEASIAKAVELLEKGSADGDGDSSLGLYQIYSRGATGYPQDFAKALDYLKLAAEKQGNATALGELGARMLNGDPDTKDSPKLVKKNVEEAIKLFDNAAKGGLAAASRILGQLYENGFGKDQADVKQDIPKAFEYYQQAARGNDAAALLRLAQAFETGVLKSADAKPDDKGAYWDPKDVLVQPEPQGRARPLPPRRAEQMPPKPSSPWVVYYETGSVVDRDAEKAFALYLSAQPMPASLAAMNQPRRPLCERHWCDAGRHRCRRLVSSARLTLDFNFPAAKIAYGMMA
jgi:TPR repeat protein